MVSRRQLCKCLSKLIMEFKECERLNLNMSHIKKLHRAPSLVLFFVWVAPALFFKKQTEKVHSLSFPQPSVSLRHVFWLVGCWTSFRCRWAMSKINVSPENPYGEVTIPRAKIRSPDDNATVIVNPMTMSSNEGNPPPYVVKEAGVEEEEARSRTCCYRCRRKKWWEDYDWFRSIYFLVL